MTRSRLRTAALAAILFLLNFYICRELFRIEYLRYMGSIEPAFIGIAKFVRANWGDLTWFPLWYGGIPFQDTYPPLLHLLVAGVSALFHWSPALAYHAVTAFFYSIGPVTLFWMALRLGASELAAFLTGLLYSTLSFSAFLVPVIRNDLGSSFYPRRLQALVFYGEGPHITALALIPVAILCLDAALAKRRPFFYLLAALSLAAVVLTNWLGTSALAVAVAAYLLAKLPAQGGRMVLTVAPIAIAAYALASPWIPPSTIATVRSNARLAGGDFTLTYHLFPFVAVLAPLGLLALKLLLQWRKLSTPFQFACLFAFPMTAITLADAWAGLPLVPLPARFHLEMEMGLCLCVALALGELLKMFPARLRYGFIGLLLLLIVYPVKQYRHYARGMIRSIDISRTLEYKVAGELDRVSHGGRVFAQGSIGFWLNAFTDTQQFDGGFNQGIVNPEIPVAEYFIFSAENAGPHSAEFTLLWLKAFGIQAVSMGGPASGEYYKPYRDPERFNGILDVLWQQGDDRIYRVPERTPWLAHVVPAGAIVARAPVNGLDVDPLRPYVAALDDPSLRPAYMDWTSNHSIQVRAVVLAGQAVSIQESWHPGWHALVNGQPWPIRADGIGQMWLDPPCDGPCSIDLVYDGGVEMRLLRGLSALTACLFLLWIWLARPRRRPE